MQGILQNKGIVGKAPPGVELESKPYIPGK